MSANTPLLTDSSRLAAAQNVENYSAGVARHINGDWSGHFQFAIINRPWVDSAGNTIPNSSRLRFLATVNGQDIAYVAPIIPVSTVASGNGPQITVQPVSQKVAKGKSVTFTVQAVGDPVLSYLWRFNKVEIYGAVSAQFVLTNVQLISAGAYDCVVSNSSGLSITNEVNLTVTPK